MAQVTSPIILDSTGQQIHSDLQQIKNVLTTPSAAADITFDNTGTGMQADDVQDAITELKSNLTDLTTPITADFVAGTYTTINQKISTNLVLPKGKYQLTITLPYCTTDLVKLFGLGNDNEIFSNTYCPFLMGMTHVCTINVANDSTYWLSTQSSGLNITISNVDRGTISAIKIG